MKQYTLPDAQVNQLAKTTGLEVDEVTQTLAALPELADAGVEPIDALLAAMKAGYCRVPTPPNYGRNFANAGRLANECARLGMVEAA